MNRNTIEDALFPDCPIRNVLARICDKWSLLPHINAILAWASDNLDAILRDRKKKAV